MGIKKVIIGFDKLIKPYRDGGTLKSPVDVTIGNITSKLMVQYRIPPEIVGIAVYKVMDNIANKGLAFHGDGEYGSKGAELFSCIKAQCVALTEQKTSELAMNNVMATTSCLRQCRYRKKDMPLTTKWQRAKDFFNEPKESYSYCIFLILIGSVLGAAIWLYITG